MNKEAPMTNKNLHSYALSLLLLGLAVGGLGSTLPISESAKIAMSIVSGLFSLCAIGMFLKAAPASRRPVMLAVMAAVALAAVAIGVWVLRR